MLLQLDGNSTLVSIPNAPCLGSPFRSTSALTLIRLTWLAATPSSQFVERGHGK